MEDQQIDNALAEALPEIATEHARRPEVSFVIRDGVTPGTVDVAAVGYPVEFTPSSPAHIIANFLRENFQIIAGAAADDYKERLEQANLTAGLKAVVAANEAEAATPALGFTPTAEEVASAQAAVIGAGPSIETGDQA